MEKMNDWAEKFMSVFPDRNRSADLDRYLTEVNNDQAEQMYFQKELDADSETRPTYEQLSLERILNEAHKNIMALKGLENLVHDRLQAFTAYNSHISKVRSCFEAFESVSGTLRFAFDSLYLFTEHENMQSKQHIFLGDLKKSLSEMRNDASKRVADYQREIAAAEKEVAAAEKKLMKSKEQAEKAEKGGSEGLRKKIENLDLDSIFTAASRIPLVGGKDHRSSKDGDDTTGKGDNVKEDVRNLLRCISYRDQVLKAARRALQKLDAECKKAMFYTMRKVMDKEKEYIDTKKLVVDKFESNINLVDVSADMDDFVAGHMGEGGELVYSAQALSLLTDLFQAPPPSTPTGGDGELMSRSRQPSFVGGSVSPQRTPQSSPPGSTTRKSFAVPPGTAATGVGPGAAELTSQHKAGPSAPPAYEFTAYLSQIFYTQQGEEPPAPASRSGPSSPTAPTDDLKTAHRKARVTNMDIKFRDIQDHAAEELLKLEANQGLREASLWLCEAVRTLAGREAFIAELNQFRSRKVNLGTGFNALGLVLWTCLSYCQAENDIRTAKVVMMLSQTFFRKIEDDERPQSGELARGRTHSEEADEDDEVGKRGVKYRQFIKETLMGHPIWQDGNYWEQTLWQCALEQLQTIPYDKVWHDMDRDSRHEAVRRVHEVVFSQVMAVTHSMLELGCSKKQCREFLYRMSVIHELSESQRMQLLAHVLRR